MPRNLEKRVEIMFPVECEKLKEEVIHILNIELQDNRKAHVLQPDDTYEKVDRRGKAALNSQMYFVEEAKEMAKSDEAAVNRRVFIPEEPVE